ncbi:MAG: hypothetical protein OEY34_06215 [Cyclobacteriaceae bacterium]|nr:hypothetical protein [Cyclobacteriaceae bacterium]
MIRFLFCFSVILGFSEKQYLNEDIEISIQRFEESPVKLYSTGPSQINISGFTLNETISKIFNCPIYQIRSFIDDGFYYSISIKSDHELEKETYERKLKKILEEDFNLVIERTQVMRTVFLASRDENVYLQPCGDTFGSKITIINRTWKGECVTISQMLSQISDWKNMQITTTLSDSVLYDFTINNDSFPKLVEMIRFDYGIILQSQLQEVEIIEIKEK